MKTLLIASVAVCCSVWAQNSPTITAVSNAEGGIALIAPNTWVEIDGTKLARANDARIWLGSDFVIGQMPTSLDNVSVTVNGKSAYVYYVSPTQVNILTPPDPLQGSAAVQVSYNGNTSAAFTVAAKSLSPSFFIFGGGPYVAALHGVDYSLLGPSGLSVPGYTFTPAKLYSGETGGDGAALREWIRDNVRASRRRVADTGRDAGAASGDHHWRDRGAGELCGVDRAGRISVQRHDTEQCTEWR